jgi:DNA polymerase-3 subunit beta
MEFTSTKNNLLSSLHRVSGLTQGKSTHLPILNNILISAKKGGITLTSTNLEIGITTILRGKVQTEGEFTIPVRMFLDFVQTLPEDNVTCTLKENNFIISSGSQKGTIRGVSSEDYPLIPKIEKTKESEVSAGIFLQALHSVSISVSTNETRPEISGCLFKFQGKELVLVGTDSFRLAEKKLKLDINSHTGLSLIIPLKTVLELVRIITTVLKEGAQDAIKVQMHFSENQAVFTIGQTELTSRLIEGQYPDYQQIIPDIEKHTIVVTKADFVRSVKSVSLFSETGVFDIMLKGVSNTLVIFSSSGQTGEGEAIIDGTLSGGEFTLVLNGRYLLDGLNTIDSDEISLGVVSHDAPCKLKAVSESEKDYLYIIMPIRQ